LPPFTRALQSRPAPRHRCCSGRRNWFAASAARLQSLPIDGWFDEDGEAAVGRVVAADAPLSVCDAACAVPQGRTGLGLPIACGVV
jgi:hypothetical protein